MMDIGVSLSLSDKRFYGVHFGLGVSSLFGSAYSNIEIRAEGGVDYVIGGSIGFSNSNVGASVKPIGTTVFGMLTESFAQSVTDVLDYANISRFYQPHRYKRTCIY